MSRVLPILFNTDMVRAILDGRKTVTRRVMKPQPDWFDCGIHGDRNTPMKAVEPASADWEIKPPYQPGDIMYVRETWCRVGEDVDKIHFEHSDIMWDGMYLYKADGYDLTDVGRWRPSIHMPKEAARIWIKVTDVRVERLQDITEEQAKAEGIREYTKDGKLFKFAVGDDWWIEFHHKHRKLFNGSWWQGMPKTVREAYSYLWNSTIKKPDLASCGWEANPWVWAIEFERCEKLEGI